MSEKIKILIAEDEDQMTHSMSFLLQVGGYDVQTVSNGREAIESITNGIKNNNPFDLLITDIQMPEMTGEELIEYLILKNI
jgi:CheY-like chemotaxis protein